MGFAISRLRFKSKLSTIYPFIHPLVIYRPILHPPTHPFNHLPTHHPLTHSSNPPIHLSTIYLPIQPSFIYPFIGLPIPPHLPSTYFPTHSPTHPSPKFTHSPSHLHHPLTHVSTLAHLFTCPSAHAPTYSLPIQQRLREAFYYNAPRSVLSPAETVVKRRADGPWDPQSIVWLRSLVCKAVKWYLRGKAGCDSPRKNTHDALHLLPGYTAVGR